MRRGSDVRVVAGAAATLTWGEFDQDGEPTNETTGTAPTVTVTRLDGTTVSTGSATDATTHWSYDLTAAQIGGPLVGETHWTDVFTPAELYAVACRVTANEH